MNSHNIYSINYFTVQAFDLNLFGNGAVLGCDFAGTVERLGKNVSKVAEGDTIAGLLWGGKFDDTMILISCD
jgi:NADPH:quinone reductase-like Zn-dependent oxidoreductase